MTFSKACFLGVLVIAAASGQGCSKSGSESAQQQGPIVVCDPFDKGSSSATNGILGSIYQLDPTTANSGTVASVQASGKLLDATVVLGQIDLPTILFNEGFASVDGRVIRLEGGVVLRDYFSLHLEGRLQLNGLPEGVYQFGILGDDGSILQVDDDGDGTYRTVVNGDGVHRTRLDVGAPGDGVSFTASSSIPFKLDYFQGPAEHLALTVVWRKVAELGEVLDVDAGHTSAEYVETYGAGFEANELFFNPPAATPAASLANKTTDYDDLLTRWSIPQAGNYLLPAGATNPCAK